MKQYRPSPNQLTIDYDATSETEDADAEEANFQDNPTPLFGRRIKRTRGGKQREVWAPNIAMLRVHQKLLSGLDTLEIDFPEAATGGIKGGSPRLNVEKHAGNRYFYQLDLADAYSQVDLDVLIAILESIPGYQDIGVYDAIKPEYCSPPGGSGLVKGGPSSPLLFNVYCMPLDDVLTDYATQQGLTYTRYLDDLTFSAPNERGAITPNERFNIRTNIEHFGLALNTDKVAITDDKGNKRFKEKKTRLSDVIKNPVIITGLQLNKNGKWQITQKLAIEAYERLSDTVERYGLHSDEAHNMAAGYKGMIIAAYQPNRQTASYLTSLIDFVKFILDARC